MAANAAAAVYRIAAATAQNIVASSGTRRSLAAVVLVVWRHFRSLVPRLHALHAFSLVQPVRL